MTRIVFRDATLGLLVFVGTRFSGVDVTPKGVTPEEVWLSLDGERVARIRSSHNSQVFLDERDRAWDGISIESVDPAALNGSCAAPHCEDEAEDGHFLCLLHGRMAE